MRGSRTRLLDILEAIENIERYAARGRRVFEDDELVQTWIIHHLQIIGEAAARLDRDFHDAHPAIPWAAIVAMRNIRWRGNRIKEREVRYVIRKHVPDEAEAECILELVKNQGEY